jgi:hypothetical protein
MAITNRLVNAWEIFKLSFQFLARDKSLVAIPIIMLLSGIAIIVPFAMVFLLSGPNQGILIMWGLIFAVLANFWFTFLSAAQSWMVHEVAQGKDTTVASGFARAGRNLGDIFVYTIVMMLISAALSNLRKNGGGIGRIIAHAVGIVTGIAAKLVLPAMIVTERSFKESVLQLQKATKAIPEIATFEIGTAPLTGFVIFPSILIGGLLFALGMVLTGIFVIFAAIIIVTLVSKYVNQTYYTLLYLSLIEKKKVKGLKLKF